MQYLYKSNKYIFPLAVAATAGALWQGTAGAETFAEALSGGKADLDMRYRYESVEQDNALKDATASTLRTRLGYTTGDYYGLSAHMDFENITAIPDDDDYNSTVNGHTQYSVIADPEGSEVNQAYLGYAGLSDTLFKLGRQRIKLDNDRFIGNVGWRQNEQTFDAFSAVNTSLANTKLTYAYLNNVNRINGGNADMSSHLLNLAYSGWKPGSLVAYAYLLDYENSVSLSSNTYGLRFTGASPINEKAKVLYTVEYALQSDGGDNPADFDLNYSLLEVGGAISGVTAKIGYEILEGDGSVSVQTPLATLHAFNGWSDQFLSTPADGLEDLYLSVGGAVKGVKLLAVFHDFKGNDSGDDYGSEWGVVAVKPIGKLYTLGVKYASYSAGDLAGKVNTDKLWLSAELKI